MRVTRKEETSAGGLENQGAAPEAVRGGKSLSLTDTIAPARESGFAEKLFSQLLSQVRGTIDTLQTRVDDSAKELVETPNQVTLDEYKEAVSHLVAFLIDQSAKITKVTSLKRARDGSPKEFVRVDIVNEKLAALTEQVLKAQKPVLNLVNQLDEIRGLLVDFYDWKSPK